MLPLGPAVGSGEDLGLVRSAPSTRTDELWLPVSVEAVFALLAPCTPTVGSSLTLLSCPSH